MNPSAWVTLVLGPETLAIRGRVVDAGGEPVAGWQLGIASGLEATQHALPPIFSESLVDPGGGVWATDEAGRFTIGGLQDRDYLVHAWDPESLMSMNSTIRAGTDDFLFRVPPDPTYPLLEGRTLAVDGSALPGVTVTTRLVHRYSTGLAVVEGASVVSDGSGRFRLRDVPRRGMSLSWDGAEICQGGMFLEQVSDPSSVELAVQRKLRFRVAEGTGQDLGADAIQVAQSDGSPLPIFLPGGYSSPICRLVDVEGNVLATSEVASSLIVMSGDVPVKTIPLPFVPGEVAELFP
jgi:hypothetical protein